MLFKWEDFIGYATLCDKKVENDLFYDVITITSTFIGISGLCIGIYNHLRFVKLKKDIEKDNKIQNNNTKLIKKIMDEKINIIYNDLSSFLKTNDNKDKESCFSSDYGEMEEIDITR